MVDSESVAVGGEVPAGVTDRLVVDQARGQGEQSERDAGAQTLDCASAVCFEGELAFAGPEHRLDPLADRALRSVASRFVFAVGAQKAGAHTKHDLLELLAGEALVGEHGVVVKIDAPQHLSSNDA